ncbi:unnamed protein product [Malus baccata var. baccata]
MEGEKKLQELMILLHLITLMCSRRGKLMARTVTRANLGLTHPSDIDTLKVYGYQCKREVWARCPRDRPAFASRDLNFLIYTLSLHIYYI